jgi:fatty-acyl-CoA synthase
MSNLPASKSARSDALKAWVRALGNTGALAKNPAVTLPALINELADKFGDRPALLSTGGDLTYRGLAERSNQYARWALANRLQPGEVVCLLMPNRPEYVACWLGITHVRGIVALINTNLTGDALAHSIGIVKPRHVIVDASLAKAVTQLPPGTRCWVYGEQPGCAADRIDVALSELSGATLDTAEQRPPSINERALHIYTSGTTGLPKAANISHFRLLEWSYWFAGMMDTQSADRMYNCLPLYHSTGGVVAIGALLVNGGSVVIRPSFSASRFWDDVIASECTLFQYIGELCRYLVNTSSQPHETGHRLRLCCGNGLQADIWETFRDRFHIPRILEFYASTEGNVSLYNCEGKTGAIGRVPPFLSHSFPVALIRGGETGEPQRDNNGFCMRCDTDETGEAIGKIDGGDAPHISRFEGYTDVGASDTKMLHDVFEAGDLWYRTGDLMRKDAAGFFYFVDRVGDTFRWKGENVSTAQVTQTICAWPGVRQAVVYGVAVPETDGKAGMATIVVDPGFDLTAFRQHLAASLPVYASPLFVRIGGTLEITGTFKPTKGQLQRDSFDPSRTEDAIYFDDRMRGAFVRVDAELHAAILNARIRL